MSSVNNFSIYQFRVDLKKQEERVKKNEETLEETASASTVTPEPIVLTGDGLQILSDINKASIQSAGPAKGTTGIQDGGNELEQALNHYYELKEAYQMTASSMNPEERITALHLLLETIDSITSEYGTNLDHNIAESLLDDFWEWHNSLHEITQGEGNPQEPEDVMENLLYHLENDFNTLNAEFMFQVLTPGIERVNYFRGLVRDYQRTLRQMDVLASQYWDANATVSQNDPIFRRFIELKYEFQEKLAEAQYYLQLAFRDLPSYKEEVEENPVQIQIEK